MGLVEFLENLMGTSGLNVHGELEELGMMSEIFSNIKIL